jgi:formylglycine-generating enzyme required for sulfatase activity
VSAGDFLMGSNDGLEDEKPVHTVYLDAFYMDKYEVTNTLYATCVSMGVCDPPQDTSSRTRSKYFSDPKFSNYPVIYVDWNDAKTYCEWRGGDLPTEAQWEKATRGTDGRTFPWGEGIGCDKANYWGEDKNDNPCIGDTTEVMKMEKVPMVFTI